MEVINFPGSTKLNKKAEDLGLKVEKIMSEPKDKINLGPVTITCRNCFSKSLLNTEGMIFRTIEYYCSECGTLHKITNPAFSNSVYTEKKSNNIKNRV